MKNNFSAADPIGQPAEAERAEHGAGEIGAVGKSDIEIGKLHCRTFLQRARQRASERDFQPIQDPGDPEREHHAGVKAAPAQIIEPGRNAGFDNATVVLLHGVQKRTAMSLAADPASHRCKSILTANEKRPGTRCSKVLKM